MPRPSLVTSSGPSPVRGFIAAISHPLPADSAHFAHGGGTGQPQTFLSVALLSRVRKQNGNDRGRNGEWVSRVRRQGLEAGAVAAAFGDTVSVVSGGLAGIVGALILARLLPGFRRQQTQRDLREGRPQPQGQLKEVE